MSRFRGEFNCTVDDKGRIKMPVSLRAQFPKEDDGKFMMKKGLDDCLEIYPMKTWEKEEAKLEMLDKYNPVHRHFASGFTIGLMESSFDNSDRFLIPKNMMKYISNAREVIVKGDLDCIQIWDLNKYEQFTNGNLGNIHSLSIEVSKYLNEQQAKK